MGVSARSAVLMVVATILWGGHYVIAGDATREMSPFSLTFVRWAVAAVPLLLIAQLVERPDWRCALREWPRLLLLSALGMLAYNLLLYAALETTTPIGASLVNAANPALMALLAAWIVRERLRPRGLVGIVVSLLGVLVVVSHGSFSGLLGGVSVGQLLMIGAIVVWSLYSIWGRSSNVPPITSTALQAALAVVVMAPAAPFAGVQLPVTPSGAWALAYVALVPSIGSYVLWNIALRTTPPGVASIFLNLITVSAVVIGALGGMRVTLSDLVGGVVIIVGVLLTSRPADARTDARAPRPHPRSARRARRASFERLDVPVPEATASAALLDAVHRDEPVEGDLLGITARVEEPGELEDRPEAADALAVEGDVVDRRMGRHP